MKKRKTYAAVMLAAGLLSLLGCATAFADAEGFSEEYSRFQDPDGILSGDEAEELNEKLDEISHNQDFDVTAALVNSLGGSSVQDYADDLYDMCDFGYGADSDGVLLLVSLEDHDWYISTSGYGITAFTDAGIQYIGEQIKPDLADGNYLDAFEIYADQCDNFITQANSGEPYDVDHMPKEPLSPIWFGISFVVGLGGALIVVGVNKERAEECWNAAGSTQLRSSGQYEGNEQQRLLPLPQGHQNRKATAKRAPVAAAPTPHPPARHMGAVAESSRNQNKSQLSKKNLCPEKEQKSYLSNIPISL